MKKKHYAKEIVSILLVSQIGIAPMYAEVAQPSRVAPAIRLADQGAQPPVPAVTRLGGSEAMRNISILRAKHPGPFNNAIESLSRRGFRPTGIAVGILHSGRASNAERPNDGLELAQYSWSGSEGEIDFWSWDDGYNGTWEGVLYAENYSTGIAVTYDLQINIEVDGSYWTVYENFDGATRDGKPYQIKSTPGATGATGIKLARVRADRGFLPQLLSSLNVNQASSQPYALVGGREYYRCAFFGCLGAAIGCAFMGPLAPECFIVACTGILVSCLQNLVP